MPKTNKIKTKDIERSVMDQVRDSKIKMKPRWIFILGSILMFVSLLITTFISIFFINIILFLNKSQGYYARFRTEMILENFPWWILFLALFGLISAIFILRRYDFSYKKNIWFIIIGFIISVILSSYFIERIGINERLSSQPRMRHFYGNFQRKQDGNFRNLEHRRNNENRRYYLNNR